MLTMPFTVAVFMVRAFLGGVGDEAQIGRLTGLLAAVYSFAQFTTSYAWGVFSSRFGRKVRVSNRRTCQQGCRQHMGLPCIANLLAQWNAQCYCVHNATA
jgi:MFS family permease